MLEKHHKNNRIQMKKNSALLPLCVDLDGPLIYNDVTMLSLKLYLQENYLRFASLAVWIRHGRAYFKQELAKRIDLDPQRLPYRHALVTYLQSEYKSGREIYLATAADQKYAQVVADHVGIFTNVFASDGLTNLRAQAKARCLLRHFGEKQFAYAGNSYDDLAVWRHCAQAIVCSSNTNLLRSVEKLDLSIQHFD
jgi:hypothetical protein